MVEHILLPVESSEAIQDDVVAPKHYRGNGLIEAKHARRSMLHKAETILNAEVTNWWASAFKYLWRWPWKGSTPAKKLTDIDKAIECMQNMRDEFIYQLSVEYADSDFSDEEI